MIIIEDIVQFEDSGNVLLKLRRALTQADKLSNLESFFRRVPNPVYRKGRVHFERIPEGSYHDLKPVIGADLNKLSDIQLDIIVMESTNTKDFDDEGISYNPKVYGDTHTPILYGGLPVYHATMLVPREMNYKDTLI